MILIYIFYQVYDLKKEKSYHLTREERDFSHSLIDVKCFDD